MWFVSSLSAPMLTLACLLIPVLQALAGEGSLGIALVGMVRYSTNQFVVLEAKQRHFGQELLLSAGERDGDIEVLAVDPAQGAVKINLRGSEQVLRFAPGQPLDIAAPSSANRAPNQTGDRSAFLRLQDAGPRPVFALYQRLVGRTLIRPAAVPDFRLNLYSPTNVAAGDLAPAIQRALAEKGVLLRPDRDEFAVAGAQTDLDRVTPELWRAAKELGRRSANATPDASAGRTDQDLLPAGTINFPSTDLIQVLSIFQELSGRTVIQASVLPSATIVFQTHTAITLTEAIYGLMASLAINGVSVAPADEHLLLVYAAPETSRITELLNRKPAATAVASSWLPPPSGQRPFWDLNTIAQFYQELAGKGVEIAAGLSRPLMRPIRYQVPPSPSEALRSLDLLLGLNSMLVVEQEDRKILKIVPWTK